MALRQSEGFWFSWDDEKSEKNLRKRDFDFGAAADAFFDEFALCNPNMDWQGEERSEIIGKIPTIGIIVVVYAIWELEGSNEQIYRIISARRANQAESRKYFEGISGH